MRRTFGVERSTSSTRPIRRRSAGSSARSTSSTLFLASSKSGSTIETRSHLEYFWERTGGRGAQFAAITDPAPSRALAHERGFRAVFRARSRDRPATRRSRCSGSCRRRCWASTSAASSTRGGDGRPAAARTATPGSELGLRLGEGWREGRDKVCVDETPTGFGLWAEQLLAESTGKQGKGSCPRREARRRPRPPARRAQLADRTTRRRWFRWEFATAVAGHVLGINPFDQPDVQAAKDKTNEVLAAGEPDVEPRGSLDDLLAGAQRGATTSASRRSSTRPARTSCAARRARARRRAASSRKASARATCTRPGSCTRAARTPASSSRSSTRPATSCRSRPRLRLRPLIRSQAAGDLAALEERGRRVVRIRLEDVCHAARNGGPRPDGAPG